MRNLLLVLLVSGTVLAQDQPARPHDDPHARCMRPEVIDKFGPTTLHLHPCQCHATCVRPDGGTPYVAEDTSCTLWCRKSACLCEPDSNPCAEEVPDALPEHQSH